MYSDIKVRKKLKELIKDLHNENIEQYTDNEDEEIIDELEELEELGDLDDLEEYNINYSLNIAQLGNGNSGNWNPNNIFIVAYVYNTATHEIIQVEENQLIN